MKLCNVGGDSLSRRNLCRKKKREKKIVGTNAQASKAGKDFSPKSSSHGYVVQVPCLNVASQLGKRKSTREAGWSLVDEEKGDAASEKEKKRGTREVAH